MGTNISDEPRSYKRPWWITYVGFALAPICCGGLCILVFVSFPSVMDRIRGASAHLQPVGSLGNATEFVFSPDGQTILVRGEPSYDDTAHQTLWSYGLWDRSGNLIVDLGKGTTATNSSDGPILVMLDSSRQLSINNVTLPYWKIETWSWDGHLLQEIFWDIALYPKMAISPNGKWLVGFSGDGLENLWSSDGQHVATLSASANMNDMREGIQAVSFSPDSQIIATSSFSEVRLWSTKGELLQSLSLPDDYNWQSAQVFFSPDGQYVIASQYDRSNIWSISGELITTLLDTKVIQYTADGRYLLAVQDGKELVLLDPQQDFAAKFLISYDQFYGVRFRADGQQFISYGCSDGVGWESGFFCFGGTATLWDKDGNQIADIEGHAEVTLADFSPDGKQIVAAGCQESYTPSRTLPFSHSCLKYSLHFHDLSGKITATLNDEVNFAFSPDGQQLLTQNSRGKTMLWNLAP